MNKYTFMGNGRNKDFYFTFSFFSKGDIVVKINGTTATGYGVFCIPASTGNNDFPFTGGRIHFARAPKATDQVSIERKLQYNRLIDYQPTERLNPTTVNQDMNYFFESLKDIKSILDELNENYAEITDIQSLNDLKARITAVTEQIETIGDITTIQTTINSLNQSVSDLASAITTHTTDIATLGTSKTSTDMDNISTTGKDNIVALSQPDNTATESVTTTVNATYTCPHDGYLLLKVYSNTAIAYLSYSSSLFSTISGIYSVFEPASSTGSQASVFPVQKGEVLTCYRSSGYERVAYFIPKKGAQ